VMLGAILNAGDYSLIHSHRQIRERLTLALAGALSLAIFTGL